MIVCLILILIFAGISSVQTPVSASGSGSKTHPKPALRGKANDEGNVFNFGEARVKEYLSSLSSNSSESSPSLPITLSPVPVPKGKRPLERVAKVEVRHSGPMTRAKRRRQLEAANEPQAKTARMHTSHIFRHHHHRSKRQKNDHPTTSA